MTIFNFSTCFASCAKTLGVLGLASSLMLGGTVHAGAQEAEAGDGKPWRDYYDSLKGKTVAFVPMSLSFEIAQAYDKALAAGAKRLGYNYVARDPNWSVEGAVQLAEQFVGEKPDILIVHPLDDKAFTRVLRKAKSAGITTIFVNLRSGAGTDAMGSDIYIGGDNYTMGKKKVDLAAKYCENASPKKIGFVQTSFTNAVGIAETAGSVEQLKKYPDIEVVGMQSAESDPNKAKSIVATMLKQHPDMCAIVDQWEGQAVGIPSAIEEAGLKGKVKLITSGGGSETACAKVADGSYDAYVSFNTLVQTEILNATIAQVLQQGSRSEANPYLIYVDSPVVTKDTLNDVQCWNFKQVAGE